MSALEIIIKVAAVLIPTFFVSVFVLLIYMAVKYNTPEPIIKQEGSGYWAPRGFWLK
jgi:hypothetical protein